MGNNKVSVIMPAYNSAKLIGQSIESVLRQTYVNFELIIVDDFSDDATLSVIQRYIEYDSRIKVEILLKNSGAAIARNKGIKIAAGRYIAFLDSDDLWTADKLAKQIAFMAANNVALSYSDYNTIDESGFNLNKTVKPKEKLSYFDLLKENQIGCLTAVYDQEILGKYFMPLIRKRQDYGLWLSILKATPYAYKTKGVLATYRIREHSISGAKFGLVRYNFELFHKYENLSKLKAFYYVCYNIYRKVIK